MGDQSVFREDEEEEELYERYRIIVDSGQRDVRIDKYLADKIPNVTRTKIQDAIDKGFILVNEKDIRSNYKVKPNDLIVISLPELPRDYEVKPENIPLNILFEDNDLIVLDKPAGMVVHPAYQNWTGTLVNALAYHFQNLPSTGENPFRQGLVHRIDKNTSGLLVIAKNEPALINLGKQFFNHTIDRIYWAIVWGVPGKSEGTINVNLGRSPKDRRITVSFPDGDMGRKAVTHYRILKDLRYVSLIECKLETGRTHQIRAHMKHLGHPVFNDATYGGDKILKGTVFSKYKAFIDNCFKIIPRQALHAKTIGFNHPVSGKRLHFESDLPPDFNAVIEKWENYINYI